MQFDWYPDTIRVWGTLLVVTVMAVLLFVRLSRKRYKLPPGPSPWPVLGNTKELNTNQLAHITFMGLKKKYGDIFLVHFGSNPSVVLNNIELVKEAFVEKSEDFAGRPQFSSASIFTEGGQDVALGQYGPRWQVQHKIAAEAFRRFSQSANMEELIHLSLVPVLEFLKVEDEPFDPISIVSLLVYSIMLSLSVGKLYAFDDPEFRDIVQVHDEAMYFYGEGMIADFIPAFKYIPSTTGRNLKRCSDRFLKFLYKGVKEHRASYNPENLSDLTFQLIYQQKMMSAEGVTVDLLTDKHLAQILADLFFAGIDTTRYTLCWFLQYMAAYPEIQKRVQDEIVEVVGDTDPVCLSHRESLPYTHAVLFEVMRIRPFLPLTLPHQAITDTKIGEFEIPAGYHCYANIWALHYDPQYWENPQTFNPDRFLDANKKQLGPKPSSWLPFSAGIRSCLGEYLVHAQLPLFAAVLLQQFTFTPEDGSKLQVLETMSYDKQTVVPDRFNICARLRS